MTDIPEGLLERAREALRKAEAVTPGAVPWDPVAEEPLYRLCYVQRPGVLLACDRAREHQGRHSWEMDVAESALRKILDDTDGHIDLEGGCIDTHLHGRLTAEELAFLQGLLPDPPVDRTP